MPKEFDFSGAVAAAAKYRVASVTNTLMSRRRSNDQNAVTAAASVATSAAAPSQSPTRQSITGGGGGSPKKASVAPSLNLPAGAKAPPPRLSTSDVVSPGEPQQPADGRGSKLPSKFRQKITRMRSQLTVATTTTPSNSNNSTRDLTADSSSASSTPALSPKKTLYSKKSMDLQSLQTSYAVRRGSSLKLDTKPNEPEADFYELLQPFQSAVHNALVENGHVDLAMADDLRAKSRVHRVSVSLDNLMLSIGDQAIAQKTPERIAHGAAKSLVELLQVAITQVASAVADMVKPTVCTRRNSSARSACWT